MPLRVSRQHVEALYIPDFNIRVSRQHVEYIGAVPGVIRVSRQHVEYLSPAVSIFEKSATSTLVLTQDAIREATTFNTTASSSLSLSQGHTKFFVGIKAVSSTLEFLQNETHTPNYQHATSILNLVGVSRLPVTYEVVASSTLSLDQSTLLAGLITANASSILEFVQYADDETKARDIEQALTLVSTASVDKIYRGFSTLDFTDVAKTTKQLSVTSQLEFTQSTRVAPDRVYATTQIEFSQETRVNPKYISASSTLELSDSNVLLKPIYVSATSELSTSEEVWEDTELVTVQTGLRDSATTTGTLNVSASSIIQLQHTASASVALATGTSLSASNAISFTQKAIPKAIEEAITSTLVFSQTAIGVAGKPVSNALELTQVGSATIDRAIAGVSTLELRQSATFTLIIGTSICQYSPFVGETTDPDAPTPPPATIDGPMAGIQVPFQLVYPSIGVVTDSVALKTPNLGNKDRLSFQRVLQETRGGTLIVYADPIWPKIQTLVLTFSGLFRVEARELLTFVNDHLGLEIGLIDWEHRYWRGIITNPDEPIIEDKFDSYTVRLDFEGELDPTWNPQVVPPGLRYSAIRSEKEDGYYVPIEPQLPATIETSDYHLAEADSTIKIGNPLYLTGAGHVNPAKANASGTTQVVGLSITDTSAGSSCKYLTEGRIERSDWTDIIGGTTLSPGITYFLSPTVDGQITSTAPTVTGQYVVRIGRAVNTTTLDIEIELPILL